MKVRSRLEDGLFSPIRSRTVPEKQVVGTIDLHSVPSEIKSNRVSHFEGIEKLAPFFFKLGLAGIVHGRDHEVQRTQRLGDRRCIVERGFERRHRQIAIYASDERSFFCLAHLARAERETSNGENEDDRPRRHYPCYPRRTDRGQRSRSSTLSAHITSMPSPSQRFCLPAE